MRVINIQQKTIALIMLIFLFLNFVMAEDFGVNMQQIQQCEPNSYACSLDEQGNEVIKKCNSAGTKYEVIETCASYEKCRLTIEDTAECVSKDKKESSLNYNLLSILGIFLIILIIILIRKKKK